MLVFNKAQVALGVVGHIRWKDVMMESKERRRAKGQASLVHDDSDDNGWDDAGLCLSARMGTAATTQRVAERA